MKAKDLKTMLDQFGDEQEVTLASSYYDSYSDQYGVEEGHDIIPYLTHHDTVILIDPGMIGTVKRTFNGLTLEELLSTSQLIQSKKLWMKLLQEKNNEEQETTD